VPHHHGAAAQPEIDREILAFPAGRHTDQVEAFSQALHRAFNRRGGEFSCGFVKGLLY
jgi:hypothetical protein